MTKAPAGLVAGSVLTVMLASCGHGAAPPRPAASAPVGASAPSSSREPPATRTASRPTTTTVPPGSLPQTPQLPSAADPLFRSRVADLWRAVLDGNPSQALQFFFPLGAYVQVKGIADPVHDYETRLIPNYYQDISNLHAQLHSQPATPTLVGVTVPNSAEWIRPGVEYNKGSYWRVYGTVVSYSTGGRNASFEITSMISWRGEWYVVHLGRIR